MSYKVKALIEFDGKQRFFENPHALISCTSPSDVSKTIKKAEYFQNKGYWVVGFLSYEAGYAFEKIKTKKNYKFPLVWFAVFKAPNKKEAFSDLAGGQEELKIENISLNTSKKRYIQKIKQIKQAIASGFTYQVNYSMRYSLQMQGEPYQLYKKLKKQQGTDYSAFIQAPEFSILSLSPELFFKVNGREIIARPMKGTIARAAKHSEDKKHAEILRQDPKNRAENLMIVDLLRNDLGRICKFGSVYTQKLFSIEKYNTLFQMTSTISGALKQRVGLLDILKNIFPSGSITGAPKIETMKIISTLEKSDRRIYTGAIGCLAPNGNQVFNVAIRTVLLHKQQKNNYQGELGVGGGITYVSDPLAEYAEAKLKGKFLTGGLESPVELIETMLLEKGQIFLLELHLKRLKRTANYFNYILPLNKIRAVLRELPRSNSATKRYKIRLLLKKDGSFNISCTPEQKFRPQGRARLSGIQLNSKNEYLKYKTTKRQVYDAEYKKAQQAGMDDVIFCNEKGEITEGAVSNIIVQQNGRKYTPPLSAGLLPGTYREHLLKSGVLKEKKIMIKDLKSTEQVFLCNSVKKIWPVELVL
ncbi:aminodeoxychorismate synthase component I [Candidatus Margulisiibacteriota bacterium]